MIDPNRPQVTQSHLDNPAYKVSVDMPDWPSDSNGHRPSHSERIVRQSRLAATLAAIAGEVATEGLSASGAPAMIEVHKDSS